MRQLFEAFVHNFYAREAHGASVRAAELRWDADPESARSAELLPVMKTDITVERGRRAWIIDTKYTARMLQAHPQGADRVRSEHLYQIFAYIKNAERLGGAFSSCEGILLYPSTGESLDVSYALPGHRIRVCTVDLNKGWKDIHSRLLSLIN